VAPNFVHMSIPESMTVTSDRCRKPKFGFRRIDHQCSRSVASHNSSSDIGSTGADKTFLSMSIRVLHPWHSLLKLPCSSAVKRRHLSQSIPLFTNGTVSSVDSKAFSRTLLLPKTSFPLRSDPSKSEFRKKTSEDLYKWQVCVTFDSHCIC